MSELSDCPNSRFSPIPMNCLQLFSQICCLPLIRLLLEVLIFVPERPLSLVVEFLKSKIKGTDDQILCLDWQMQVAKLENYKSKL